MTTTITGLSALTTSLARVQKAYTTVDTDGNGALSKSEFETAATSIPGLNGANGQTAANTFNQLDSNHDGLVTKAEVTAGINLATQVQSVLLQGQEIASGGAFAALLGATAPSTGGLFGGANNYAGLTSSPFGTASSTSSLADIVSGGNANTAALGSLLGTSGNNALLQQIIARYTATS